MRFHLLITTNGLPVEVMVAPGGEADVTAFKSLALCLSPGSHADYLDDQEQALPSSGPSMRSRVEGFSHGADK